MLAIINTLREHPGADFWGFWDELKERERRGVTNEGIARNALAFAATVSICYFAAGLAQGVQNYLAYAY